MNKLQLLLLEKVKGKIQETLPEYILQKVKLTSLENALTNIHKPQNTLELRKARFRLKFEELFFVQLKILSLKHQRDNKFKGFQFEKVGHNFNTFYKKYLPFELTDAQKRVIKEIRRNVGRHSPNEQVDTGRCGKCGKRWFALMSMLLAIDNGFQSRP